MTEKKEHTNADFEQFMHEPTAEELAQNQALQDRWLGNRVNRPDFIGDMLRKQGELAAKLSATPTIDAARRMAENNSMASRLQTMLDQVRTPDPLPALEEIKRLELPRNPLIDLAREQKETTALMLEALLAAQKSQEEMAAALQKAEQAQKEAAETEKWRDARDQWQWWLLFSTTVLGIVIGAVISLAGK